VVARIAAKSRYAMEATRDCKELFDLLVTIGSVPGFVRYGILFTLFAVVLAGCTGQEPRVYCPSIRIPEDVGVLTRFAEGGETDITDVRLEARFVEARGSCTVDDELVEVAAILDLGVREGPASTSSVGQVSIFIAVAGRNREILQRRTLPITVDFSGNKSTVLHRERLLIEIPKSESQRGDDFVIFAGFEMGRDELQFNRATQ